jgi:hypothetical protein
MIACNTRDLTLTEVKSVVILSVRHQIWEEGVFSGMNSGIGGTVCPAIFVHPNFSRVGHIVPDFVPNRFARPMN